MAPKGMRTAISTTFGLTGHPYAYQSQAARIMNKSRDQVRRDVLAGTTPAARIGLRVMIPTEWVREHAFGNHQHEQARRRGQATRQKVGQRTQPPPGGTGGTAMTIRSRGPSGANEMMRAAPRHHEDTARQNVRHPAKEIESPTRVTVTHIGPVVDLAAYRELGGWAAAAEHLNARGLPAAVPAPLVGPLRRRGLAVWPASPRRAA